MSDSDKPKGILPAPLQEMRCRQRLTHFPLHLLGWLCLPIGGWRFIALLTLHHDAGWYYCGNVGDANHHTVSGPFPRKSEAWREGVSRIPSLYHDRIVVFYLWDAPPGSYDPRKTGYVATFWFLTA